MSKSEQWKKWFEESNHRQPTFDEYTEAQSNDFRFEDSRDGSNQSKKSRKRPFYKFLLVLVILIAVLGSAFLFVKHQEDVKRARENRRTLTVGKLKKSNSLMVAAVTEYAVRALKVSEWGEAENQFSSVSNWKKTDFDEGIYEFDDGDTNESVGFVLTGSNQGRVIFRGKKGSEFSGTQLSEIVHYLNSHDLARKVKSLSKNVHVNGKEGYKNSPKKIVGGKSDTPKKTNVDSNFLTNSDFDSNVSTNSDALKAIIYYGTQNSDATRQWKQYVVGTNEVPNTLSQIEGYDSPHFFLSNSQAGGVYVRWPEFVVTHDSSTSKDGIEYSDAGHDPYFASYDDIIDFVNNAGGRKTLANVDYQMATVSHDKDPANQQVPPEMQSSDDSSSNSDSNDNNDSNSDDSTDSDENNDDDSDSSDSDQNSVDTNDDNDDDTDN
ncbi:hypothetical protein [Furfurilactobacillus rossiae]|uniref:Uncharacterized protein n=1 Tax=Furfurilactobacillus rossiae DSM 15814 TaxID=1114972 RepID=A0A0R1RCU3_9LACO|nr:hypothetical protein [Furfurilactobacillus rossiae]KRL54313.1 hypothetical protein FD35_GL002650 [Furfurilactobacillus rossiae DSM 15814]QFR66958.1 hypothetical protein LR814_07540 [Furfurilactobacillus rossiae]QLE62458.1 hypothetical protein LROSRS0_2413 [Furfurilactobacillus rossiae]